MAGKKIHLLIENSEMEVYDGDHYFFLKQSGAIAKKIETIFLETLGK